MSLRDNPQAVAVAERIKREQGFDPLDVLRVSKAISRYSDRQRVPGARKTAAWMLATFFLVAISWDTRAKPPAMAFFSVLLLFSLILTIRYQRAYARNVNQVKRETLPFIHAYIECLWATSDDPKMQKRIEIQWLREKGLDSRPGPRSLLHKPVKPLKPVK